MFKRGLEKARGDMVKLGGVAIQGYGGYIPRYRIRAEEIGRMWGQDKSGFPVAGEDGGRD